MKVIQYPKRKKWPEILSRPVIEMEELEAVVNQIFKEIKVKGDKALMKYTWFYDRVRLGELEVSSSEWKNAEQEVSPELKKAMEVAALNIERFHKSQFSESEEVETFPGVKCWRKSTPIEKVGLYVPGGSAPLFSTVLMLGIPARLAGCKEIILCTPPSSNGKVPPAILYAAQLVGIQRVFMLGGIQAIGAMALGTQSVPAVYKIFGPGNQFVTAAKQLVNKVGVAIDMPAGPSEVLVLADGSSEPSFVAADLLSQAEHGADSQVILVTWVADLVDKVQAEVETQMKELPRKDVAQRALVNSKIILVDNQEEALELVNQYGPEHLIVSVEREEEIVDQIRNAGSVFLGNYTPESAGDYASGTNHTLPTNGFARAYSGVDLEAFMKNISFQKITPSGLKNLGPTIEIMAQAEELEAHRKAVRIRLDKISESAN
ncbi:MAG: histidinol dehydrogenase [Marinifilaceae bacterium]|jgi:histidinol dehydrogenase